MTITFHQVNNIIIVMHRHTKTKIQKADTCPSDERLKQDGEDWWRECAHNKSNYIQVQEMPYKLRFLCLKMPILFLLPRNPTCKCQWRVFVWSKTFVTLHALLMNSFITLLKHNFKNWGLWRKRFQSNEKFNQLLMLHPRSQNKQSFWNIFLKSFNNNLSRSVFWIIQFNGRARQY